VDISLDGAPCALWSGTPTPPASWLPAKTTEPLRLSRSGMTCRPLTDAHGEAVLMWCLADSLARTSASQDEVPVSTATPAGCGDTWRESSARYDRDSRSWRTHRSLWDEVLPESSVTLPRWGMMRDGVCSERLTSALPIRETASGLLPKWPTPTAHNAKETNAPSESLRNTPTLAAQAGGPLSPTWIEWLMGWPLGWTALDVSATDRYQQWLRSHGGYCVRKGAEMASDAQG
jgi:hypothetical protein